MYHIEEARFAKMRTTTLVLVSGIWMLVCLLALPLGYGWDKYGVTLAAMFQSQTPAVAAEDFQGQWIIETTSSPDRVSLTMNLRRDSGGSSQSTSDFPLSKLRGLTTEQMNSNGANVTFQLIRDAGAFNCEGWFKAGKGSGHFTFIPSAAFVSEMGKLGYDNLSNDVLFTLAIHDVSLSYIQELKALGYDKLELEDLMAMKIHGVSTKFIVDLKARGYENLSPETLVAMRIHRVTIEFIDDFAANGYKGMQPDEMIAMRIHGVTPEFVKDLAALGYTRVPAEELVAMRIHGVSTSFITDLKTAGYDHPSVEQLVAMRIHGVTVAFIQQMKARGYRDLSIENLLALKIRGFDN